MLERNQVPGGRSEPDPTAPNAMPDMDGGTLLRASGLEAAEGGWVVIKSQPRRELMAARSVAARGVEAYVPLLGQHRASKLHLPVFPGYLFARPEPDSDDLLRIRSVPGVSYLLPRGGAPARLPEAVISFLRRRVAQPAPALARGDRVIVLAEPFRSVEAIFDRRLNANGRVQVLLELVHRAIVLNLQESDLRRVG